MRLRERKSNSTHYYTVFPDSWSGLPPYDSFVNINDFLDSISDVNNKLDRPESPCRHHFCKMVPVPQTIYQPPYMGPGYLYVNYVYGHHGVNTTNFLDGLVSIVTDEIVSEFTNDAYAQYAQIFDRFSAINFFAELGDVSNIAKGLGQKAITLSELKRAGSELNYLDWEFGVKPMLQDSIRFFDRLATSAEAINAKLAAMQQPIKFARRKRIPFPQVPSYGLPLNGALEHVGYGSISVSLKGSFFIELPRLTDFDRDWYIWLDQIGFKPDLATVWESIPFSWFADWFIPIGDSLEQLSGNWFSPIVRFSGTRTVQWKWFGDIIGGGSSSDWLYTSLKGRRLFDYVGRGYYREPVNISFNSFNSSAPEVSLPVVDLRKTLIGASILDAPQAKAMIRRRFRRRKR